MQLLKKYLLPFIITLLMFSFLGFYPTDCDEKTNNCSLPYENVISDSCTFKQFQLYGNIKFVESFPDVKIQIVNSFPDLKVKIVDNFPNECGEWKIVESFPDLKVQIVESFPDFTVEFVESFPGKSR